MFKNNSFSTDRYVAPLCETLDVKVEGMFCGSPNGYNTGGGGSYGDNDTHNNGDF